MAKVLKKMEFNDETGRVDIEYDDKSNRSFNLADTVTATTTSSGGVDTLPNATGPNLGIMAYLPGIGVGGSYWYSDGARWRPVGGSFMLHRIQADVTGVSGTAPQLMSSAKIPAGLMKTGDILRVTAVFEKSGTTDALDVSLVAAATESAATGPALVTIAAAIATSGRTVGTKQELQRVSETEILPLRGGSFGGPFNGASSMLAAQSKVAIGSNMDSADFWLALVAKMGGSTDIPKATTFYVEYIAG